VAGLCTDAPGNCPSLPDTVPLIVCAFANTVGKTMADNNNSLAGDITCVVLCLKRKYMSYDFPQICSIPDAYATVCNECYLRAFFSVEAYVQILKIKYLNKVKKSLRNGFTGDKNAYLGD
jgi:hypothetical protein